MGRIGSFFCLQFKTAVGSVNTTMRAYLDEIQKGGKDPWLRHVPVNDSDQDIVRSAAEIYSIWPSMETGEALVVFRGVPNCQGWEIWSKLFNQSTGSIPGHDLARGREKHTKTHTWIGKTRNSCSLLMCTEVRSCGAKLRGCCNTKLFNERHSSDRVTLIEYDCGNRDDKSSSSTWSERNAYFHESSGYDHAQVEESVTFIVSRKILTA